MRSTVVPISVAISARSSRRPRSSRRRCLALSTSTAAFATASRSSYRVHHRAVVGDIGAQVGELPRVACASRRRWPGETRGVPSFAVHKDRAPLLGHLDTFRAVKNLLGASCHRSAGRRAFFSRPGIADVGNGLRVAAVGARSRPCSARAASALNHRDHHLPRARLGREKSAHS